MRRPLIVVMCLVAVPAAAQSLKPGQWEATSQMTSMSAPDMPADMMKAMAGKSQTFRYCVRADDLAKAPERLFQGSDGHCRYTQFKMTGGNLSAVMQCKGGMTGKMTGTFTPTSYVATNDMSMSGGIKMTSRVTARRVGDCK